MQERRTLCLLNGSEATLPMQTDLFSYYKWSDMKRFYTTRIASVK